MYNWKHTRPAPILFILVQSLLRDLQAAFAALVILPALQVKGFPIRKCIAVLLRRVLGWRPGCWLLSLGPMTWDDRIGGGTLSLCPHVPAAIWALLHLDYVPVVELEMYSNTWAFILEVKFVQAWDVLAQAVCEVVRLDWFPDVISWCMRTFK